MPRKDPNGNDLSAPRSKPQSSTTPRWNPSAAATPIDWAAADPKLIARVVVAVTLAGDAVMFGQTSDGGALVLNVYSSPPTPKTYIKPNDDVDYILTSLAMAYEDAS